LLDSTTIHPRSSKSPEWVRTPFLGKLSLKLSKILGQRGLRPAFYSHNSSKNLLSHLNDPVRPDRRSGVYHIHCNDCPSVYIGQTGQQLRLRIHVHTKAIRNDTPEKSNFSDHILASRHNFDSTSSVKVLHSASKGKWLTTLENIQITKAQTNPRGSLLNAVLPTCDVSLAGFYYPSNNWLMTHSRIIMLKFVFFLFKNYRAIYTVLLLFFISFYFVVHLLSMLRILSRRI